MLDVEFDRGIEEGLFFFEVVRSGWIIVLDINPVQEHGFNNLMPWPIDSNQEKVLIIV